MCRRLSVILLCCIIDVFAGIPFDSGPILYGTIIMLVVYKTCSNGKINGIQLAGRFC